MADLVLSELAQDPFQFWSSEDEQNGVKPEVSPLSEHPLTTGDSPLINP